MKKLNITRGEWKLLCKINRCEIYSKDNDFSIIAINHNVEEFKENAKLILNAPKLYEALQDLVLFCEENKVGAELELAKDILNKCSL